MLLAISLDISNVFNTLPWWRVGEVLEHHQVPPLSRRHDSGLQGQEISLLQPGRGMNREDNVGGRSTGISIGSAAVERHLRLGPADSSPLRLLGYLLCR